METMKDMAEKYKVNTMSNQTTTSNFDVETVDMRVIKKQNEIERYKNLSNLPKKFQQCTFNNATIGSKEEQRVKLMLEKYCQNFDKALEKGIGIYLYGVRGTGKTFYSLCIFNELSKKYSVYRTSLAEIYNRIKKTFKNGNSDEEEIYKDLLNADLIIFDDLGKERLTEEWGKEKLFEIFNLLYEQEKCLIISTTLDPEQMKEYTKIQGSDDVLDRLRENCKGIAFNWESRRKEIKKEIFKEIFG